jgi:hypothetical protein
MMIDMESQKAALPLGAFLGLTLGILAVSCVWLMLYLGFLKTAATAGQTEHLPAQLVRCGRPYFWRYVFFLIKIQFLILLLASIVVAFFASKVLKDPASQKIPDWFQIACALGVLLGMIKPMLLIPARIIVYGNTTIEALFSISFYRLGQFHHLYRSIGIGFGLLFAASAYSFLKQGTVVYYIFSGFYCLVFAAVMLFLTLQVVLEFQEQYTIEQRKYAEK